MTIDGAAVTHWRGWIGRQETRAERLDAGALRRFAAAIGEPPDIEAHWPSLGHWAFFLPVAGADAIGEDGHDARGGFLPPVSLPRRMFAAAEIAFDGALRLGAEAVRTSTIRDVRHLEGDSGTLVLIDVEHAIAQDGATRVLERQTLLYRAAGGATPAIVAAADVPAGEPWRPNAVDLFRFSAATFNGHRIHYDLPYAQRAEGYPALVVQGPFTAARLFGLARRAGGLPSRFSFRAHAPLFEGSPVWLAGSGRALLAIRADGVIAMAAEAAG